METSTDKVKVTLYLPEEVARELRVASAETRIPQSALVEAALTRDLPRVRKAAKEARR